MESEKKDLFEQLNDIATNVNINNLGNIPDFSSYKNTYRCPTMIYISCKRIPSYKVIPYQWFMDDSGDESDGNSSQERYYKYTAGISGIIEAMRRMFGDC